MKKNNYNYPILDIPPVSQADLVRGFQENGARLYTLNYGGRNIISIAFEDDSETETRIYSDGTMQSLPLVQQYYITAQKPIRAVVTMHMREEALCLKPQRTKGGQAIQAQMGGPLLYGANGFYGVWEDLMLEWYGAEWNWVGSRVTHHEDGSASAAFEVEIKDRAFYMLLRPRYYSQHLGYKYFAPWKRQPNTKGISGWCSWEAYHRDVTQENVADAAKLMSQLAPFGLEYIQLDDGFQNPVIPPEKDAKIYESWLKTNERFPGGHEEIIESIRSQGLTPAIWTNAIITNDEAAETELCMKDKGELFKGYCVEYIMDCSDEMIEKHVLPYYEGLKKHGYEYFKTDAIRHLCYDGMQECVRRGLMTDEQADERFRSFMEYVRKGIGDETYLLSCWGILSQSIGLADAFRVGTDATPEWEHVHMQIMETARCFFAHRIMFTIDPDHICARTEVEWARMLLSFVSVTGGLYMLSDELECYDEPRMEIIRKTLPSLAVFTGETGPLDYTTPAFCWSENPSLSPEGISDFISNRGENTFATCWATHFCQNSREWTVITRTALLPLEKETMSLADLGMNPHQKYAVYDFWEEKFLGTTTETVEVKALPLGHVQVLALTPIEEKVPVLIASDRHVSMDAVSIVDYQTQDGMTVLKITGVEDKSFTYSFYSEKPCEAECSLPFTVKSEGALCQVTIHFDKAEAELTIKQK